MTIEIGLLLTVTAGIIGTATFYIGRQTAAKRDGERWGEFSTELKKDIEYIKNDVTEIKASVTESSKATMVALEKETQERRDSVRRLHIRFDEHLKIYHNAPNI